MKILHSTLLCVAFSVTSIAHAADQQAGAAKPLTYEQAISVDRGLKALDGYQDVVADGQQQRAVTKFYKFGAGLRIQIGQSEAALDESLKIYQREFNRIVTEFHGVIDTKTGNVTVAKQADFDNAVLDLLHASSGVVVAHIKAPELNLAENPIPPSVLAALVPILDQ